MITSDDIRSTSLKELYRVQKLLAEDLHVIEREMWERVVQGQHNRTIKQDEYPLVYQPVYIDYSG